MTQSEKLERKPCAVQPLPSLDLSVTSMAFCPLYGDDPSHRAVNVFDLAPRGRGFRDLALVLRADHFVPPRLTPAGENVDVIGGAHDSAFKLRPH
jgi:hypothetical protein